MSEDVTTQTGEGTPAESSPFESLQQAGSAVESLLNEDLTTAKGPSKREIEETSETGDGISDDEAHRVEALEEEDSEEPSDEEAEEAETTQDEDEEIAEPETLAELAELLKVDVEYLRSLKDTAKVDGEEIPVTLQESVLGYQRTADYTKKTQDLKQKTRDLEAEFTRYGEELKKAYDTVGGFMTAARGAMGQEAQTLQERRRAGTIDAEAYLSAMEQLQARFNTVEQLNTQLQEQGLKELEDYRAKQRTVVDTVVRQDFPDYGETQRNEVKKAIEAMGYTAEQAEAAASLDANAVKAALKMGSLERENAELKKQLAEVGSKTKVAKKKVKAKPQKVLRKKAPVTDEQRDQLATARAKKRLKSEKSVAAAAAVLERLGVSR